MANLAKTVGFDDEERLLCPVRALKEYLRRMKRVDKRPRNLFSSLFNSSKPLSKNGLSYLLRKTIADAHRQISDEQCRIFKVRAHDIRGIATTLNVFKNMSFRQVLAAATWKTSSVFVTHYLKDVMQNMEGIFSLGPLVVGGGILV